MATLTISDMMNMQAELQEKYRGIWQSITPDHAQDKLLWAAGEMGEIVDIFKKEGWESASKNENSLKHLCEETADVMMYLWDMLSCMGITPETFSSIYEKKHAYNMKRTFGEGHFTDEA